MTAVQLSGILAWALQPSLTTTTRVLPLCQPGAESCEEWQFPTAPGHCPDPVVSPAGVKVLEAESADGSAGWRVWSWWEAVCSWLGCCPHTAGTGQDTNTVYPSGGTLSNNKKK